MIAVYMRVSSDIQAENNSVASQRFSLKVLCAARNWEYPDHAEYIDEAVSGSTVNREAYQRLLADIEAGKVKRLLVYDLDRVSRDADERMRFLKMCREMGAEVVQCTGDVDITTPEGIFMQRIMAAVKELDRKVNARRTSAGIRARIASGVKWGGAANAGKRSDQRGVARFTPGEVEELKALYASGEGCGKIAKRYGTTDKTVMRTLKRAGVQIRSNALQAEGAGSTGEPVPA